MKYFAIFFFTLTHLTAFSQFILKGKILASDNKKPLGSASVFLSNTSVGTVTNASGEFTLSIPSGKYDLIASYVGYETSAQTLSNVIDSLLVISLKPKVEVFDEVIVGGYEKDGWKNWGNFFLSNFIGTTESAEDCEIKNSDVIKFRMNKKQNKLYAVALDQLVIENKSLGYTIKYQLEEFEYDFTNRYLLYLGYPLFTQMSGGNARQNRWKKRREDAYYGSMMDFMRALFRNRIREEGYEVRRLTKTPNEEKLRVKKLYRSRAMVINGAAINVLENSADTMDYYNRVLKQPDELSSFSPYTLTGDSIAYAIDSVTAGLEFNNYLHIIYKKAAPPLKYRQLSSNNAQMMSELKLVNPGAVHVQSNGNYYPPLNLISLGYWAWSEKIGDMLPFDYRPPARKD